MRKKRELIEILWVNHSPQTEEIFKILQTGNINDEKMKDLKRMILDEMNKSPDDERLEAWKLLFPSIIPYYSQQNKSKYMLK